MDKKWETDPGFVFYDFSDYENLPAHLFNTFDVVVIDPPFITKDVWTKYSITAKLLSKKGMSDDGNFCCLTRNDYAIIFFYYDDYNNNNYYYSNYSIGKPLGKVILTTIAENADLLFNLFGAKPVVYKNLHYPLSS